MFQRKLKLSKKIYSKGGRYKVVITLEKVRKDWAGEPRRMLLRLYEPGRYFWKEVWREEYDANLTTPKKAAIDAVQSYEETTKEHRVEKRKISEETMAFKKWDGML